MSPRDPRAHTDESLRAERAKTDIELARSTGRVAEDSDALLRAAREQADAIRSADRRREESAAHAPGAGDELAGQRAREEAAIARERKLADVALHADRVQQQAALASLLAAERLETDSHLLLERGEADRLLDKRDELLALVSHDLRSLLGAVALHAAVLESRAQVDSALVARSTGPIKTAVSQMTRLVSDLLEVASFEVGKFVLQPELHDACALVHQITDTFAALSHGKALVIAACTPERPLRARFDPQRIAQVLGNLVGNAIKFTAPSGQISISVDLEGANLRFAVADSGEGIPPERVGDIFERYSQAGGPTRGSLGLGLYIARRIVEAHGGRIWVESTVGRGSVFQFSLPASQAAADPA